MILENGVIHTLEPSMPQARALAIAADRVAGGVGTHETALPSPERIDLGGRCVLPGFNDAHVHFPSWSAAQTEVRLEGAASIDEALSRVAEAASSVDAGRWLRGRGWRSGDWSPEVEPTRHALDAVTGETPTALMARDYHSLWLNSAALERAAIPLDVEGGVVERDEQGEPTGVLREESAWAFRDAHLVPEEGEFVAAMREGLRIAATRGVTAVHDKDGWLGAPRYWRRLEEEGALTLRVWQSLPGDLFDRLEELMLPPGIGSDYLRVGYLKVFMDGTLGSQTARLLDGSGVEITSKEELAEIVAPAAEAGWPVAVHAIGDAANRDALDAFAQTREAWQSRGLRPRIEHAQLLADEDIPRFAELGVAASVQFSHAPSDRDVADRLWAGKTDRAYAYRSLADSGARVANGSDAPIEELDPWAGICAGVLRTLDDREAWHPEQAVSLEKAIEASITTPAWLAGEERRRGKLVPGFLADLVVLDRDPFAVEPDELPQVQVLATMLGGRWVHNPPPWD